MIVYVFEYEINSGMEQAYWDFMEAEGAPFWLQFPEVKRYEVYSKLGGHGSFEGRVELESFAAFDKIWSHPDIGKISQKTAGFTHNTQRRFLVQQSVYEK